MNVAILLGATWDKTVILPLAILRDIKDGALYDVPNN